MSNKIGVLVAQGLDVPKFVKDVPNFAKNVSRVPKLFSRSGTTSNHFPRASKGINGPWEGR